MNENWWALYASIIGEISADKSLAAYKLIDGANKGKRIKCGSKVTR